MPYSAKQVAELQTLRDDPTYDGMTDAQFHTAVTADTVSVPNDVTANEVFNAFVGSELPARSSDEWQNLLLLGAMNGSNSFRLEGNVLAILTGVFAAPTTTRANLTALSTRNISPAQDAGLPNPSLGDVARTT